MAVKGPCVFRSYLFFSSCDGELFSRKSSFLLSVRRVSRLRVSHLARSRTVWFFCAIQVVAIAADAPLTEPSTPANTVIRFASMLLMKRWFSRQRRTGLRRRDCFGATLFEPHDDNVENRRQEQTKSSYSEHSEKDRGAEGLSHFRTCA